MATRQKSTPEPETTEVPLDPEQAVDGVVVIKVTDDEGNINTQIQPLGKVQVTEIETLLGLGLNGWRAKLGLN